MGFLVAKLSAPIYRLSSQAGSLRTFNCEVDSAKHIEPKLTTRFYSQIDDCTKEWTFPEGSLDYVHIRFLTGCIADWEALMKQAYRCLKPGGYIESMEPSAHMRSDDNTIEPDSAMGQWGKIFVEGGSKMGRPFTVVEDELQNKALEKAGFVDIHEEKYKVSHASQVLRLLAHRIIHITNHSFPYIVSDRQLAQG